MLERSSSAGGRGGRKPRTSRGEVERVAFELFDAHGFEHTTIDDIAEAAGIGRRTFFRYFPSKNDVVWGEFDAQLVDMRERFAECSTSTALMEAVREVVVGFNRIDPAQAHQHRRRMTLILTVPALQAYSTLRYADWRRVVAEFAGRRMGHAPEALHPQAIAHATLGVAVAAYERWLADPDAELAALLDHALGELAAGFGTDSEPTAPPTRASGGR